MKLIDIENWNRKEHYEFFSKYDDPFFGIVTEIDCTKAYETAKKNSISFFAYYLHQSIMAVNQVEEMKIRIVDSKVVIFENIHAATTIGRTDGTFGFSFINFSPDFKAFSDELKEEINHVRDSEGLRVNENAIRHDVIHYSTLPWNKFTGLTHAKNFKNKDTVPKITFGKIITKENIKVLPVSIIAHHGLVDGLHIAQYLDKFQKLMNK